jgi:chromosome condensin MukBEF complex kleisin-like MukF subunit
MAGLNSKLNSRARVDEQSKKGIDQNGKTIFSGFVAQEVERAAKDAGYDFSGVDKPKNENDMYGLRYSEFVVPLVKAVQEQQQMINDLKKINSIQNGLNEDLQKRIEKLESLLKEQTGTR